VVAAFDPALSADNGAFLDDCVVNNGKAPAFGTTDEVVEQLWELSEKLWNVKFGA
jgi:hypothetical protein